MYIYIYVYTHMNGSYPRSPCPWQRYRSCAASARQHPSVWPRPSGGRPPQLIGGSKLGMFNHQKVGFYHDFNMKNGMFTVYKLDLTIKIIKTCDFTMKNADVTIKRLGLKHEK